MQRRGGERTPGRNAADGGVSPEDEAQREAAEQIRKRFQIILSNLTQQRD